MKNEIQNMAKLAQSMEYFGKAFLSMAEAFKTEIDEMAQKAEGKPEQLPLTAQAPAPAEKKPRAKKEKAVEAAQAVTASQEQIADAFTETPAAAPATVVEAATTSAPQIDEATLRNKLVEYAQKHGKDKAYSILGKFDGAKKVNELKPELMPKVYNELSAGL
jgi:hypothetical protein